MLNVKKHTIGDQTGYHNCGDDWFSKDSKTGELTSFDKNTGEKFSGKLAKRCLIIDGLNNPKEFDEVVSELNINKDTLTN